VKRRAWWPVAACIAIGIVAIPLIAAPLLQPLWTRPPLSVTVHDEAEQVRIGWSRAGVSGAANIEITDGDRIINESIAPDQASFTYRPQNSDLRIKLTAFDPRGKSRAETARFIMPSPPVVESPATIPALETEAGLLREAAERGRLRVAELQGRIAKLEARR
jgi:hypothetical protein